MKWLKNKKVIAVHSSNFHPDDVFCIACLSILYKGRIKVSRTREEKIYTQADIVVDIGFEYDPTKNRFDHHQPGGAGERPNGIPYSSFGLLWKKYGEEICESAEVADMLDKKLVQIIDADDNGLSLYETTIDKVYPFTLTDIIYSIKPTWKESNLDIDLLFFKAVALAKDILEREIKVAKDKAEINLLIRGVYKESPDKRLIIIDTPKVSRYEIWDALQELPEPLFIVYGRENDWSAVAMRKGIDDLGSRKSFPAKWGGLRDAEFARVSGVPDALFCHNGLFLIGAKSKDGAIRLAKLALEN